MNFHRLMKKKQLDFDRDSLMDNTFKKPAGKQPLTDKSNFGMSTTDESSDFSLDETLQDTVNVFLRLKPVEEVPEAYQISDEVVTLQTIEKNREYKFTRVLDQLCDQKTCYDICVRPIVSDPFSSVGAAFASYGVSNSGKTYTILGEHSAGLVPRALVQFFSEHEDNIAEFPTVRVDREQIKILSDTEVIGEMTATNALLEEGKVKNKFRLNWNKDDIKTEHQFEKKPSDNQLKKIHIWISFVEIYNEKIRDLFAPQQKLGPASTTNTFQNTIRIISNKGNSFMLGVTSLHVSSVEKALELLQIGLRRATYAETGMNSHSSRSHTVFTINLISECEMNYEYSSFKFCDLAGAERTSKTGNVGDRLKETGGINKSLSVLGKCLDAVLNNQKHVAKKVNIPVRESKLTLLLQSSLMGQQKFVMIVNLLPSLEAFEENINVLEFGSIANKIVTRKTEVRKFHRQSYSFFMQNVCNSPKMNSSLIAEESVLEADESELDFSYAVQHMSAADLRVKLRSKVTECDVLRQLIEQKEYAFLAQEREIRHEMLEIAKSQAASQKELFQEDIDRVHYYYKQKLDAAEHRYQKLLNQNIDLEEENMRLRNRLGISEDDDDDDIVDLDESDEIDLEDDIENFAPLS